eukprot:15460165-Alexandrium_andersonii.AAC.2
MHGIRLVSRPPPPGAPLRSRALERRKAGDLKAHRLALDGIARNIMQHTSQRIKSADSGATRHERASPATPLAKKGGSHGAAG